RIVRNESKLAKPRRARVGIDQLLQYGLSALGRHPHDPAAGESKLEILDDRAAVAEGLGRSHDAVHAIGAWHREDFLGRNVRSEGNTRPALRSAAHPQMTVGQANRDIGAGSRVLERCVALGIEMVAPLRERFQMRLPRGYRI